MNKKNKQTLISILIPIIIAVLVVSVTAISGKVTKTKDIESPTAATRQTTTTEQTTLPQDSKVSIVAVGDNLIHMPLVKAGTNADGTRDYNSFYDNIRKYTSVADLAIINQETMLGGDTFDFSGYPLFNTPWEIGDAAIAAGFDVFTCATNHSLDVRAAGIEKECEFFSKHPEVTHVGTYTNEDDYNKIAYVTVNDITFAILNYTFGTNGIPVPEDKPYLVKLLTEENVTKDVKKARKKADVVIVCPHWGTENSHDVNDEQKKYTKLFSDLGVDIVLGTHPHALQPVEWYTNEETGKKMLVYYSLGNFISHQTDLNLLCGGMAEITVERKAGEIEITSAKLAPTVNYYSGTSASNYKFSVYKFCDYNNDIAASQTRQGTTVEYFTELVHKVISDEFLDLD